MMKNLSILLLLLIFPILPQSVLGQSQLIDPLLVNCDNRSASCIREVYENCPETLTDELVQLYTRYINQVELLKATPDQANLCPLLSKVILKNKCNQSLQYDTKKNFDPQNFNPLKYIFNFDYAEDLYFRIDDTNYVVHIKPYK